MKISIKMKHLFYTDEYNSLNKNIKALKLIPKLTQREIAWLEEMKKSVYIDAISYSSKYLIDQLTKQEIINLIKVNPELLEIFI
jgi:hypothetical protein